MTSSVDPATIKFGVRLIDDLGDANELIALGKLAEDLGYDTLWYPHDKFRFHSWVLHSAVAQITSRIQLYARSNIYSAAPSEITDFISTLDHVSNGRANLTVGLHNFDTVTWVGMTADDVLPRVREATTFIRRLLAGESGPMDGEIYHFTEKAFLRIKPLRERIPILVCPIGEDFLELSGEIGDGSLPMVTPPESAPLIAEGIKRGLAKSEDPDRPFDMCAFVWMAVDEDRNAAAAMLADVAAYFGTYLDPRGLGVIGLTVEDFQPAYERIIARDYAGARALMTPDMLRTGIYGTPEDCARQLEVVVNAGFNHISIGGPLGRNPADAMRLIAERVIPAFRPAVVV